MDNIALHKRTAANEIIARKAWGAVNFNSRELYLFQILSPNISTSNDIKTSTIEGHSIHPITICGDQVIYLNLLKPKTPLENVSICERRCVGKQA